MKGKHNQRPRAIATPTLGISTFAVLAVLAAAPVDAQDPAPGDVVRVSIGEQKGVDAAKDAHDGTLFSDNHGAAGLEVPLASVQPLAGGVPSLSRRFSRSSPTSTVGNLPDLETSQIRRDQGLIVGGVLGFAAGVGLAYLIGPRGNCGLIFDCWVETAFYTAPIGLVVGAAVGYAAGSRDTL